MGKTKFIAIKKPFLRTSIFEDDDITYGYCVLPEAREVTLNESGSLEQEVSEPEKKPVFLIYEITTWDGRKVMSIHPK